MAKKFRPPEAYWERLEVLDAVLPKKDSSALNFGPLSVPILGLEVTSADWIMPVAGRSAAAQYGTKCWYAGTLTLRRTSDLWIFQPGEPTVQYDINFGEGLSLGPGIKVKTFERPLNPSEDWSRVPRSVAPAVEEGYAFVRDALQYAVDQSNQSG